MRAALSSALIACSAAMTRFWCSGATGISTVSPKRSVVVSLAPKALPMRSAAAAVAALALQVAWSRYVQAHTVQRLTVQYIEMCRARCCRSRQATMARTPGQSCFAAEGGIQWCSAQARSNEGPSGRCRGVLRVKRIPLLSVSGSLVANVSDRHARGATSHACRPELPAGDTCHIVAAWPGVSMNAAFSPPLQYVCCVLVQVRGCAVEDSDHTDRPDCCKRAIAV